MVAHRLVVTDVAVVVVVLHEGGLGSSLGCFGFVCFWFRGDTVLVSHGLKLD